jgi:aminoacrylate peracid reductase
MHPIIPADSTKPLASNSPGARGENVAYDSGTSALDGDHNVVHVGDAAAQTRHVMETVRSLIETSTIAHLAAS